MKPEAGKKPGEAESREDGEAYEVGYGKPPRDTRFKPGRSGNPNGRPKGSRNRRPATERLHDLILEEANRQIQVRDGGVALTMSVARAVFRSLSMQAAQGKQGAQRQFLELVDSVERERRLNKEKLFSAFVDHKLVWESRIEEARRLRLPEPQPFPHPDDLVIDPLSATVTVTGPVTREQKADFDERRELRSFFEAELESEESWPVGKSDAKRIKALKKGIARVDRFRDDEPIVFSATEI